jgi:hypothetical protein
MYKPLVTKVCVTHVNIYCMASFRLIFACWWMVLICVAVESSIIDNSTNNWPIHDISYSIQFHYLFIINNKKIPMSPTSNGEDIWIDLTSNIMSNLIKVFSRNLPTVKHLLDVCEQEQFEPSNLVHTQQHMHIFN